MDPLYQKLSLETGRITTRLYSTSFSAGLMLMDKESRRAIYSIYAFLRQADEIVDTFHEFDKVALMDEFETEYYRAYERGISLNLIINAFVVTVKRYSIPSHLVQAFLKSMKSDLENKEFNENGIKDYIYGSADVVGLMCLKVMTRDNPKEYDRLHDKAMKLSSAFQKINFLRDIKNDTENLSRNYFPILNNQPFDDQSKEAILVDIRQEFREALEGVRELPKRSRAGVYLAYRYYMELTRLIGKTPAKQLAKQRVRVNDFRKTLLFSVCALRSKLGKKFMV